MIAAILRTLLSLVEEPTGKVFLTDPEAAAQAFKRAGHDPERVRAIADARRAKARKPAPA